MSESMVSKDRRAVLGVGTMATLGDLVRLGAAHRVRVGMGRYIVDSPIILVQ